MSRQPCDRCGSIDWHSPGSKFCKDAAKQRQLDELADLRAKLSASEAEVARLRQELAEAYSDLDTYTRNDHPVSNDQMLKQSRDMLDLCEYIRGGETTQHELGRLRQEVASKDSCWHCKVCLLPTKPRCETCPDECDDEACSDEGCRESRAAVEYLRKEEPGCETCGTGPHDPCDRGVDHSALPPNLEHGDDGRRNHQRREPHADANADNLPGHPR